MKDTMKDTMKKLDNPSLRILRCVPKRLLPHVQSAFVDSDGIWIWFDDLVDVFDGCSTLHCYEFSEIRSELSSAVVRRI